MGQYQPTFTTTQEISFRFSRNSEDDLGIQWINYRDRKLSPHSCETPAPRSTALTTVPNKIVLFEEVTSYFTRYPMFSPQK